MFRILVAEAERGAGHLMQNALAGAGYRPLLAGDGQKALELLEQRPVDLMVLDVMLPRLDGFSVLERLRRAGSRLPVLILTEKDAPSDARRGLYLGADDYMSKPADREELLLRTGALLHRVQAAGGRRLTVGATTLLCDDLSIKSDGKVTELPRKEFLLLYKLLSCPGKTFTRRQLMDEIWGLNTESDEHTVNVHINRLRGHLKGNRDIRIVTVRGLGYKAVQR